MGNIFMNSCKKQLQTHKKYDILHKQKEKRPYRLAVRTAPSHGANSGSREGTKRPLPCRDSTKWKRQIPDKGREHSNRIWPYRLAVRTAPSHGANSGSSPDKVTIKCGQKRSIRLNPRKILGFLHFKEQNLKTHFYRCKIAILRYLTELNSRIRKK